MDVSQWLRETSLPRQKRSPASRHELPHLAFAQEHFTERPSKRRRKNGYHESSDSSILEAGFPVHKSRDRKNTPLQDYSARELSSGNGSSSSEELSTEQSEPDIPANKYERKPRRKTRPDRYLPKQEKEKEKKKRKARSGKHGRDKRKSKKSTKKRRAKDNPASGLVMGFHAKNVPKDRLTLKGPTNLGLFKKGRASSPVRGRGLPDLVFSEMRFLSKKPEQPQRPTPERTDKKSRKKTTKDADQEEISAYFAPRRPALAERDLNVQAHGGARVDPGTTSLDEDSHRHRHRPKNIDTVHSSVELPEKAFLGFGSRGARPATAASYYSWAPTTERLSCRVPSDRQANVVHKKSGVPDLPVSSRHSSNHDHPSIDPADSVRLAAPSPRNAPRFPREMTTIDVGQLVVPPARNLPLANTRTRRAETESNSRGCNENILLDGSHQAFGASYVPPEHTQTSKAQCRAVELQGHQRLPCKTTNENKPTGQETEPRTSSPLGKLLKACATTLKDSVSGFWQPQQLILEKPSLTRLPAESRYPEEDVVPNRIELFGTYEDGGDAYEPATLTYQDDHVPMRYEELAHINLGRHYATGHPDHIVCWEPSVAPETGEYEFDRYGDGQHAEQWEEDNEDMMLHGAEEPVQGHVPYEDYAYEEAGTDTKDNLPLARFWRPNKLY